MVKTTSRQNLQLVGVAALFISSKYEELYPPEIADFVYITDDTYTKHQVIDMEKHILKVCTHIARTACTHTYLKLFLISFLFLLQKLKFELGSPLTIHFLRRYSKAAKSDAVTHIMSKYFIELAAIDYQLCGYHPSQVNTCSNHTESHQKCIQTRANPMFSISFRQIAAASLFVSLCVNGNPSDYAALWTLTLQYHTTYTLKELMPIIQKLAEHILNAPTAKLNNVYKKYRLAKCQEVAATAEASADILKNIINFAF